MEIVTKLMHKIQNLLNLSQKDIAYHKTHSYFTTNNVSRIEILVFVINLLAIHI